MVKKSALLPCIICQVAKLNWLCDLINQYKLILARSSICGTSLKSIYSNIAELFHYVILMGFPVLNAPEDIVIILCVDHVFSSPFIPHHTILQLLRQNTQC